MVFSSLELFNHLKVPGQIFKFRRLELEIDLVNSSYFIRNSIKTARNTTMLYLELKTSY